MKDAAAESENKKGKNLLQMRERSLEELRRDDEYKKKYSGIVTECNCGIARKIRRDGKEDVSYGNLCEIRF